jgi:ABC-type antimicrobial peptide transport system ATPase subunit
MCLISIDEDGNFNIEEEALKQIRRIDLPLVIVAVVGLCRTGKSYLMNRLAGQSAGNFLISNARLCLSTISILQLNQFLSSTDYIRRLTMLLYGKRNGMAK